jgi:hypothetical protein
MITGATSAGAASSTMTVIALSPREFIQEACRTAQRPVLTRTRSRGIAAAEASM